MTKARIDSTQKMWRVQVRMSRVHKWVNKGLFETREAARAQAVYLRDDWWRSGVQVAGAGVGFGNTRVVRYVKGA